MKCYVFLPCFHEPPINECLSNHFIVFLYVFVSYLQLAVQYKNNLMYNVNGVQMTNFLQTLAFIFFYLLLMLFCFFLTSLWCEIYASSLGIPTSSIFLCPAVTPWKTVLPTVGYNNPGIRLYKYDKSTMHVKVMSKAPPMKTAITNAKSL